MLCELDFGFTFRFVALLRVKCLSFTPHIVISLRIARAMILTPSWCSINFTLCNFLVNVNFKQGTQFILYITSLIQVITPKLLGFHPQNFKKATIGTRNRVFLLLVTSSSVGSLKGDIHWNNFILSKEILQLEKYVKIRALQTQSSLCRNPTYNLRNIYTKYGIWCHQF